ncbi:pectate lyase [Asanoa hainanensis]|uniref:Pectate lyase n=1 Tax=Asanoa hainanensis TaxID=560556 RepID=A0A239LLC1_9ACTN|nr:pectate lyase [Asanoa hainanensis]SNT30712.1 pectate lyase [Asanoa hainanensis]
MRFRALLTALLLAVVGVAVVSGSASAATLLSDDFADGDAAGWTTSGGSWAVSGGAYRQTGQSSDARSRVGSAGWTDYTVRVRVTPAAFNGSNRFVAVLARAQSATSYYYVALRSNNTVELKRLVSGASTTLDTASLAVTAGRSYVVALTVAGSVLSATVDGVALLSASDTRFTGGQAGVATYYASSAFDDVVVETAGSGPPLPSPSPSPTVTPTPTVPPTDPPPAGSPDGFASVAALGLSGTTGGAGGPTVTVDTSAELLEAIDTIGPMTIQVAGRITISSKQGVRPNKTIVGIGSAPTIAGGGFDFYRSYNVIVRNLTFLDAEDDAINVGQESHHVWIDHNTFVSPVDGSIDIVRGADYVTVSWNHFAATDKSMLISHSDGAASTDVGHLKVTIHHNFFDRSRQRHPRVRFGEPVHVYNNYFLGNELYGVASTMNGGVLVEGNYFSGVPFPCFSGSGYADSGPGRLVQRDNVFSGSGPCEVAGSVVEPRTYYSYTMDSASVVPARVSAGAGAGKL